MKRARTSTGHVTLIRVNGVGLCGGVVGRNKEKLQGANSQNITTKTKMRMWVKQTQKTENSCAFVALSTDICSKTANLIQT